MRISDWSSDVCASVLEDRVGQAGADPPALAVLAPGQQFVAAGALAPIVESVDVDKQTLWRRSPVEFEDETVGAAVAELNRYSEKQPLVADMRSAKSRVGKAGVSTCRDRRKRDTSTKTKQRTEK